MGHHYNNKILMYITLAIYEAENVLYKICYIGSHIERSSSGHLRG